MCVANRRRVVNGTIISASCAYYEDAYNKITRMVINARTRLGRCQRESENYILASFTSLRSIGHNLLRLWMRVPRVIHRAANYRPIMRT